jgi:hypothetical protein
VDVARDCDAAVGVGLVARDAVRIDDGRAFLALADVGAKFDGLVVTMAARSPGAIASMAASATCRATSIGRSVGMERSIRITIRRLVSSPVRLVATSSTDDRVVAVVAAAADAVGPA